MVYSSFFFRTEGTSVDIGFLRVTEACCLSYSLGTGLFPVFPYWFWMMVKQTILCLRQICQKRR